MWIAATALPEAPSHPFYHRLNAAPKEHGFDTFAKAECAQYYAETMGRPSIPPGVYFRMLVIGYFRGHRRREATARETALGGHDRQEISQQRQPNRTGRDSHLHVGANLGTPQLGG